MLTGRRLCSSTNRFPRSSTTKKVAAFLSRSPMLAVSLYIIFICCFDIFAWTAFTLFFVIWYHRAGSRIYMAVDQRSFILYFKYRMNYLFDCLFVYTNKKLNSKEWFLFCLMIINIKIRWFFFFYNEHTSAIIGLNIFSYFKQRTHTSSHTIAHNLDVNRWFLHNLIFFFKNIDKSKLLTT